MSDLCSMTITGNLTRDPETKTVAGGRMVTEFTVAVGRWNRKERKEEARFIRVNVWSQYLGERVQQRAQKGTKVVVIGEHDLRMWEGKVYEDLRADHVELVTRLRGQQQATPGDTGRQAVNHHPVDNDDDVPF